MEETTPDVLIDEPDAGELEPPPQLQTPIVMGDVQQAGMGAAMGAIEPKVVFDADSIPSPPFGNGPDESDIALIEKLKRRRDALTERVHTIEELLGFVESAADLAVRVAKIERFVGITR